MAISVPKSLAQLLQSAGVDRAGATFEYDGRISRQASLKNAQANDEHIVYVVVHTVYGL
jgi:hypothetical protein